MCSLNGYQPTGNKGNKKEKNEKQIKVPKIVVPNFEVSEEVEIDEEDIEFFKDNLQHSGFLSKMDTVKLAKYVFFCSKLSTGHMSSLRVSIIDR